MKQLRQISFVFLLSLVATVSFAQTSLSGKVTDSDSKLGLIGATVSAKGTSIGTVTDVDGKYVLDVPAGAKTLIFSYVGYATKEVAIGDQKVIDIALGIGLELGNVVVVGSRNQTRTKLESPVPVDIIPISNVVNEIGQVDVNQILTYIAPSFQSSRQTISDGTDHVDPAQLRGLGPDQVLVLVNGKRRHQSALVNVNGTVNRGTVGTDMNAIPASSIDRIEILRDGAAAQYGSDAIAGVINIVLKRKTGVLDFNASQGGYNTSYAKNYGLYNAATINGVANTNVGRGFDPNVRVMDGGTTQLGANYGIKVGEEGFINLTGEYVNRGLTNRAGTYTGQIYPKNGAGQFVDDSIMAARGQTRNTFDMRIGNSAIKSYGLTLNSAIPISSGFDFYAFGGYNKKKGESGGTYRYFNAIPALARATGIYPNGFLPLINTDITDISYAAGIKGKLAGMNADLSYTHGENTFDFGVSNSVSYTQVIDKGITALQTSFDAGGLNFGQNTINLDLNKKYEDLGLNLAFGGEYRTESFTVRAGEEASWKNFNPASGAAVGSQVFSGFLPSNAGTFSRSSQAGYLDLEKDFSKAFMVGAALRFENYSDFGSTFNYKIASRYKINDVVTIRGSLSTGFRAPSLQQKFYAKTNTLFITTAGVSLPVEAGTFINGSPVANAVGIPTLKQETSNNYSVGATFRIANGLEISIDAYQIDIKDRIILTNNFAATSFPDTVLKAQVLATGASTVNFFTNAVNTRNRGVEAVMNYSTKIDKDQDLKFTFAATYIDNSVIKNDTGLAVVNASQKLIDNGQLKFYYNREDQSRMEVGLPKTKASLTFNYRYKDFSFMLRNTYFGQVQYLDGQTNSLINNYASTNAFTGARETTDQIFNPKTTTDLTISCQATKALNLAIGGSNIFDVYPDIQTHSDNQNLGRFIYSRRVNQMGYNGAYFFGRIRFTLK
jgi:iron complex outermembrane recepter protein